MNLFATRLRRHPFAVEAHFDRAVALSFAFPVETLRAVVSPGLKIDAYEGFGFITVALVWTRGLRPAGLPLWLGQDFFLAGYRLFTRLQDGDRRLRGLQTQTVPITTWAGEWSVAFIKVRGACNRRGLRHT